MKRCWLGTTETTAAFRAYVRTHGVFMYPIELYDLTLPGLGHPSRLTLRWCDQPMDVPFFAPIEQGGGAATYASGVHIGAGGDPEPSPKLQRGQRKESIGVEVDDLSVDAFLDGTEDLPPADGNGATSRFTLAEAILNGLLDGAVLYLRRLHLALPPVWPIEPTGIAPRQLTTSGSVAALASFLDGGGTLGPGDTSLGAVTLFGGLVTESSISKSKATLTVKAALEKLQVGIPRNIYQAGCLNDLGDRMCKVDVEAGSFDGHAFKATGHVSSAPATGYERTIVLVTTTYPTDTETTQPPGYFDGGTLQFTSGAMAGLVHTIEMNSAIPFLPPDVTRVPLVQPLPRTPAPGDGVVLRAGCRKTIEDCAEKFGNFVDGTLATITFGGDTYTDVHLNGLRFRGCPRIPPPESAI